MQFKIFVKMLVVRSSGDGTVLLLSVGSSCIPVSPQYSGEEGFQGYDELDVFIDAELFEIIARACRHLGCE
jgi:hypothetical protein